MNDLQEITLERMKFCVAQRVCTHEMEHLVDAEQLHSYFDMLSDSLVFQMKAYVWGESPEPFTIEHPSNWWEAVKERFAPRWFLDRWPVRTHQHEIAFKVLYPDFKYAVPDHKPYIKLNYRSSRMENRSGDG